MLDSAPHDMVCMAYQRQVALQQEQRGPVSHYANRIPGLKARVAGGGVTEPLNPMPTPMIDAGKRSGRRRASSP